MESPKPLNPLSLKSVLTLRYDLSQPPTLPKLAWKDFSKKTPDITNTIEDSIKQNILNSVPESQPKKIAISLSGGLDSSLSLLLLRQVFPDSSVSAFSVKFDESIDETPRTKEIADHLGALHKVILVDDYFKKLPAAIGASGLPYWDIHWYYVAERARPFSKYLVSGDGGDELFGGYVFRYSKFLSLIGPDSSPIEKVRAYLECHLRDHVPDHEKLFAPKAGFYWSEIYDALIPYFDNPLNPLDQVFLADYNGKMLYNFAIFNSRILKHFEMMPVTPLLSKEIACDSAKMTPEEKYNQKDSIGKLPLRKILQKHGLSYLFNRQKLGFSVNTTNLWRSSGRDLCSQYLLNFRLVEDSWISKDWIVDHIDKRDLEVRYVNKFFGLLAFEAWYRIHITHEMNPNSNL